MEINYDIVNEDEERGTECLAGSFDSKKKALQALAEQRQEFPDAYLIKSVMTRCREGAAKKRG